MATEIIDAGSSRETGGPRRRTPGPALDPACNLPPVGLRRRRSALQDLRRLAVRREDFDRGIVLLFNLSDETAKAVMSFVLAERRCCRQFRYSISFMPGLGTFSLTVDAPPGHLSAALKALYSELG